MRGESWAVLTLKVLALTVLLVAIHAAGVRFLPEAAGGEGEAPAVPPLPLVLSLMLLQTVALAYPIIRSRWRGWKLAAAVFVLYFGTVTFLSQVESLVYLRDRVGDEMISGLFLAGLFHAAVFAPVAVLVLGRWRGGEEVHDVRAGSRASGWSLAWRTLAAGAVFVVLYYVFGYYVAWSEPAVRE